MDVRLGDEVVQGAGASARSVSAADMILDASRYDRRRLPLRCRRRADMTRRGAFTIRDTPARRAPTKSAHSPEPSSHRPSFSAILSFIKYPRHYPLPCRRRRGSPPKGIYSCVLTSLSCCGYSDETCFGYPSVQSYPGITVQSDRLAPEGNLLGTLGRSEPDSEHNSTLNCPSPCTATYKSRQQTP